MKFCKIVLQDCDMKFCKKKPPFCKIIFKDGGRKCIEIRLLYNHISKSINDKNYFIHRGEHLSSNIYFYFIEHLRGTMVITLGQCSPLNDKLSSTRE